MNEEMIKQQHGNKYYEFDNVVNKDTRKQVFGVDTYEEQERKKMLRWNQSMKR